MLEAKRAIERHECRSERTRSERMKRGLMVKRKKSQDHKTLKKEKVIKTVKCEQS